MILKIIIIILIIYLIVYLIVKNNIKIYKSSISNLKPLEDKIHSLCQLSKDRYIIYNPSLVKDEQNNFIYTYRLQNKKDFMSDILINKDNRNLLISSDFNLEDPRIFIYNHQIYIYLIITKKFFIFNPLESLVNKQSRVGILKIPKTDKNIIKLNPMILETDFALNNQEKNWMLLQDGNQNYFVYSINPFKLLKFDIDNFKCELIFEKNYNIPKNLRGGSQFIKYKNIYIGVVHTRYYKKYYHNFVILKEEYPFEIIGLSQKFVIGNNSNICFINKFLNLYWVKELKFFNFIQFVSGIIYDEFENVFILTYGEGDKCSKQIEISPKIIFENIIPI